MAFITVAQLFLNGLHLLIQVVLALATLHLFLHATTNALFDLQQIDLAIEQCQHVFDTGGQFDDLEDFLLLFDLERHVGGHRIDQPTRLIDAVKRREHLSRYFLAQLDILFELGQQAADEHLRLTLGHVGFVDQ